MSNSALIRPRFSREQFTQEFLPTMQDDGTYFTWEQVNCNNRPDDVKATQVWTVYRQDDGSMIVFNRPALGANEVGYVVCAEDLPGGNDLLAARWWDTEAQAHSEIYRWAKTIASKGNTWAFGWAARVLANPTVLSNTSRREVLSEQNFTLIYRPSMDVDGNYFTFDAVRLSPPVYVWTVFDDDKGGLIARAGRITEGEPIGYLKSKTPWNSLSLKAQWSGPVDFKSNITLERPRIPVGRSAVRSTMGLAGSGVNGYKAGPTKGSSYRVMEEPVMVKSGPEATEQRLHDLEVGDVSQDEHMEYLEGRIEALENLVRLLTQNLDGTIANVGAMSENMKAVARLLEQG